MNGNDEMVFIKEIISPISHLLKNQDGVYDMIWEADFPDRGKGGAIGIQIDGSELIIVLKDFDKMIGAMPIYMEFEKTINLSDPDSLDVIREVIEKIKDGYKPRDGVDGWESY